MAEMNTTCESEKHDKQIAIKKLSRFEKNLIFIQFFLFLGSKKSKL